jgi:hypothetical protein
MRTILLQLADVLPRKTVVDLSRGSRKQLRKTGTRKRKITKAQSGSSTSTSKHARAITNETSDKEVSAPGGLSRDSSLMSIESLTRKVSSVVCCLFDLFDLDVQPAGETIGTLMLVKQRLRLARTAIQDILGDQPL